MVPLEILSFDAELRGCPGYEPTEPFYRKVVEKYAGALDLEEQGMRIRGWFAQPGHRRRVCSAGFVLGWLRREVERGGGAGLRSGGPGRERRAMRRAGPRGKEAGSGDGRAELGGGSGLEKYG